MVEKNNQILTNDLGFYLARSYLITTVTATISQNYTLVKAKSTHDDFTSFFEKLMQKNMWFEIETWK